MADFHVKLGLLSTSLAAFKAIWREADNPLRNVSRIKIRHPVRPIAAPYGVII
jgi:hypothetical protein